MIEESLYRGTQWVVFEPNDERLWGQIRLNVGAFLRSLFEQGAFQGSAARDAYFVKCDTRHHHAERHRPRHRQRRGRVRAAQAGRVRGRADRPDHRTGRGLGVAEMAEFTVNAQRFDPYKNFKFLVLWDGRVVAGVSKISPLKRMTEVVKHRSGGDREHARASRRAAPSSRASRWSAASPTTPSSTAGPTRSGTVGQARGSEVVARRLPQGHRDPGAQRGRAGRRVVQDLPRLGRASTRCSASWTPTPTPSRSRA